MAMVGRPVRLVAGEADLSGGAYAVEPRCAWLFQVNRLAHFSDLSRREFAEELRRHGYPADEWKLTRWESGDQRLTTEAARALDDALGSERPFLTAAVAYLNASPLAAGRRGRERPLDNLTHQEYDEAFERVLSGAGSGTDWFNVLIDRRIRGGGYIPPRVWKELTGQLGVELSRSVGPARSLRKRAVNLLIAAGGQHVFEAFREVIGEATCQSLATLTSSLVYGRGQRYNDLAVAALEHPDQSGAWGAMHAVAAKLSLGHFRSSDIPRIESKMLGILGHGPLNDAGEALLRALPARSQLRVTQSVRNGELLIRSLGTLQPLGGSWKQLVRALANQARDTLRVATLREDSMLEALVTEGILHPHYEGRAAARITLAASPYRAALAQASLDALPSLRTDQQARVAEFLVFVADASHADALTSLTRSDIAPAVRDYAFLGLARIPGPLSEEARAAIRVALGDPTGLSTRGAIYALGMHGVLEEEWDTITRIEHPLVGECWKNQGTAIFD